MSAKIHSRKNIWIVFLLAALLLGGCKNVSPERSDETSHAMPIGSFDWLKYEAAMTANPCGMLKIQQPFVNVTGFLTAHADLNGTLYLFLAPDHSFNASFFAVQNCAALFRKTLRNADRFSLGALPEGDYVVMIDRRAFSGPQGFPIIREFNASGLAVQMVFHGGSPEYSMATFTIHRVQNVTQGSGVRQEAKS